MINTILAIAVVALIGLVLTVIMSACAVSGRISDMERQADEEHAAQQRADN